MLYALFHRNITTELNSDPSELPDPEFFQLQDQSRAGLGFNTEPLTGRICKRFIKNLSILSKFLVGSGFLGAKLLGEPV